MTRGRSFALVSVFILSLAATSRPVGAADIFWDGLIGLDLNPDGIFGAAGNWHDDMGMPVGAAPAAGDIANFDLNDTYTVAFTQNEASNRFIVLDGTVTFLSDSATVRTYDLSSGTADTLVRDGGVLNIGSDTNPLFVLVDEQMQIGTGTGDGAVTVSGAESRLDVLGAGLSHVGSSGRIGDLTITDGATANFATNGTFRIGVSGIASTMGTVLVDGAGKLNTGHIELATAEDPDLVTGFGEMTVTGGGSTITQTLVGATLTIGTSMGSGTGTLNVDFGGTFATGTGAITVNATGVVDIQDGTFNANGPITLAAGSTLTIEGGELNAAAGLDNSADGTLSFLDGTLTLTGGAFAPSSGSSFIIDGPTEAELPHLTIGEDATMDLCSVCDLRVGDVTRGELLIVDGGTIDVRKGSVGTQGSSNGTATVDGNGSRWTNTETLIVGSSGDGALSVTNGASVFNTEGTIGYAPLLPMFGDDASGMVNVDGKGSTWTNSESLTVGFFGDAALNITNGGSVFNTSGEISKNFESSSIVTVSGADAEGNASTWSNSNDLYVGGDSFAAGGTGVLNVETEGVVSIGGDLVLWDDGTVNLVGGRIDLSDLVVNGGTFNFNFGTLNFTTDRTIATGGLIETVLGGQLSIDVAHHIGVEGTATLLSLLTIDGGTFSVGELVNPQLVDLRRGTLNINNQPVAVETGGPLGDTLDLPAGATINVALGLTNHGVVTGEGSIGGPFINSADGELQAPAGKTLRLTGSGNTNNGQVTLSGGQVHFTQDFINNSGGLVIGNGTLRADGGVTNDGSMAFSATANVIGDVTNGASGTIISAGGTTTFFDDVVNEGEIRTDENSFTVYFGSYSGSGDSGTGTVIMEGDLKPGSSPGTMAFGGSLSFGAAASLEVEINGLDAGSEFDVVTVADAASLNGQLNVVLLDDFVPTLGDTFEILTATGGVTGSFATESFPTLGSLLGLQTLYDGNSVTLAVVSTLAGDYNGDGVVDAADYTVWRDAKENGDLSLLNRDPSRENGTDPVDEDDYAFWRGNFGLSLGSGAGGAAPSQTAVPEPSTVMLGALAAVGLLLARRRRALELINV